MKSKKALETITETREIKIYFEDICSLIVKKTIITEERGNENNTELCSLSIKKGATEITLSPDIAKGIADAINQLLPTEENE